MLRGDRWFKAWGKFFYSGISSLNNCQSEKMINNRKSHFQCVNHDMIGMMKIFYFLPIKGGFL